MKKGLMGIACAVALLSGCQQKPDDKILNACWSPDAKQAVQTIATRIISKHIVDSFMSADHGNMNRTQVEQFVAGGLTVTLSDFYLISADSVSGSVNCGADAGMSFKRRDGKVVSANGASFSFSSYRSEGDRSMYVVPSGLPLVQLIDDAVEMTDAPVSPGTPAQDTSTAADAASAASSAAASADAAPASPTEAASQ